MPVETARPSHPSSPGRRTSASHPASQYDPAAPEFSRNAPELRRSSINRRRRLRQGPRLCSSRCPVLPPGCRAGIEHSPCPGLGVEQMARQAGAAASCTDNPACSETRPARSTETATRKPRFADGAHGIGFRVDFPPFGKALGNEIRPRSVARQNPRAAPSADDRCSRSARTPARAGPGSLKSAHPTSHLRMGRAHPVASDSFHPAQAALFLLTGAKSAHKTPFTRPEARSCPSHASRVRTARVDRSRAAHCARYRDPDEARSLSKAREFSGHEFFSGAFRVSRSEHCCPRPQIPARKCPAWTAGGWRKRSFRRVRRARGASSAERPSKADPRHLRAAALARSVSAPGAPAAPRGFGEGCVSRLDEF